MIKIDFKNKYKELYRPSNKKESIVEVPKMNYLMIDGQGDPNNSKEFEAALESLYGISYTLKFMFKDKEKPKGYFEYVVPPLEGLWWMKEGIPKDLLMLQQSKENWRWTLMIMLPDFYTSKMIEEAKEILKKKKNPISLEKLYVQSLEEGLSVQILYIGPYSDEMPTIEKMHDFAFENGFTLRDKHHEIYLSDPRRTAPEKLKTVLRHPLVRVSKTY